LNKTLTETIERAKRIERKRIGMILKMNSMEEVLIPGEKSAPNPLWNVRIYDDEIEALLKGERPEGW